MARSDSAPGPSKVASLLAALVTVCMLAGVLTAGLFLPAVGAVGQVARGSIGFFDALPAELKVDQPSQQSRILWSDGSPMATFYYENRILVPLGQISPIMRQAIVDIEDSRFYEHNGADPQGILRAVVRNASREGSQGASTLTQQWIKNVLLNEALAKKDEAQIRALQSADEARKVREIKLAVSAEKKYSKDQILENYLNIALFGDGQFGVQTASQRFFGKPASQLNLADAALLAGIVRQPSFYNPLAHPDHAESRRNVVLNRMLQLGTITQQQHDEAVATPIAAQMQPTDTANGCSYAGNAAYFCEYVTYVVRNDPAFGPDEASRLRLLYGGGLVIKTTLDHAKQEEAARAVFRGITRRKGIGAAVSSVDSSNGNIVAMAQNRTYTTQANAPAGQTAINYNVDQAYGGGLGFQPGSTYKPFTLATWLASGRGLDDTVSANRRLLKFKSKCDPGASATRYGPYNAEGRDQGSISVLQASYNSVNTAYASMANRLDLCDIRDTAASLGVHRADGQPLKVNPASILGSNEIAPLTMASAFGGFANGGIYCKPIAIISVTDSAGKDLPKPEADCHQVIDPAVASQVNYALSQVLTRGTAKNVGGIGRPSAGKTGTTNDSTETWFVGYAAGGLSTASWVGTPEPSPKRLGGGVYGATYAAPIWRDYMGTAVQGMPEKSFSAVSRAADAKQQVTVPRVVGQSESDARQAIEEQNLSDGPTVEVDSGQAKGTVVGTSPKSGSRVSGGTEIRILISNGSG